MKIVGDVMTLDPFSVERTARLHEVMELMATKVIRHVPVVDEEEKLVGIISDRDLLLAIGSPFEYQEPQEIIDKLSQYTVEQMTHTEVHTVGEQTSLVEATKLMRISRTGCLPVVSEVDRLLGVVSYVDLLDELIRFLEPEPLWN